MKKQITILVLLILAFSCKKDKEHKVRVGNKIDQTQSKSFLSASIDGKVFHADVVESFLAYNIIIIAGVSNDKTERIRIYIEYKNGPSTYTFGKGISNGNNMDYTNNKKHWLAAKIKGKGTVTLTEKGDYLMGKFSFTGVSKEGQSEKKITNGEFKINKNSF